MNRHLHPLTKRSVSAHRRSSSPVLGQKDPVLNSLLFASDLIELVQFKMAMIRFGPLLGDAGDGDAGGGVGGGAGGGAVGG